MKRFHSLAAGLICAAAHLAAMAASPAQERPRDMLTLGRHLVKTSGCNDCHSPGYTQKGGQTPESSWLTGDALGWQGPWGTTYPTNLRLFFARLTEEQWLRHARTMEPRPPMPWFNVRAMSEVELKAIYRYIKTAGPAGVPAPAYRAPGEQPSGPVVRFP